LVEAPLQQDRSVLRGPQSDLPLSGTGFRSYLAQYRSLLGALENFRLVYVANSAARFEQVGKDFARALGLDIRSDRERTVDGDRLLEHFEDRVRHERHDYRGFDTARINRLADELREFRGPQFEALFAIFQEAGGPAMLAEVARIKAVKRAPHGVLETEILPYSYAFLGQV
jgi:hypothetical protein